MVTNFMKYTNKPKSDNSWLKLTALHNFS